MKKEKCPPEEHAQHIEIEHVDSELDEIADGVFPDGEPTAGVSVSDEPEEADNSAEQAVTVDAVEEWKEKYLRLAAEFDNYRKRTLREKADLIAFGGEDVIKSMLGISDDLDRAVQAVEQAREVESVKEGVLLIVQKIGDLLRSKGVSEIKALGQPFDADLYEAVAKVPVQGKREKGRIIDVIQKGYKLKEKVIRYPKVVVGE